jgi:hypothetical protein
VEHVDRLATKSMNEVRWACESIMPPLFVKIQCSMSGDGIKVIFWRVI